MKGNSGGIEAIRGRGDDGRIDFVNLLFVFFDFALEHFVFKFFLIIYLMLFGAFQARAAAPDSIPRLWVTLGAGAASVQNHKWEMSAGFSANASRKNNLIGVRADFNQEFTLFETPIKNYGYAAYAGKYYRGYNELPYAALGAGISVMNYYTYGALLPSSGFLGNYHELDSHFTAGLALDAQCGINLGKYFSIGIHGYASINPQRMIGGALFSLRIGNVAEEGSH